METRLFLKEKEVHVGMVVALCLEGKEQPEMDEKQKPLVLKALLGGVPTRKKFYPLDGGIIAHKSHDGKTVGAITAHSLEGFQSNVRFMPTQVFLVYKAPVNTEFVVFVDGKRLKYEEKDEYVYILKDSKGHCRSFNGYVYDRWLCDYPLPKNAVLVPISDVGKEKDPPVFSPSEAPVNTGYTVHHEGKYLKYPGTDKKVRIFKDKKRWFISNNEEEYRKWGPVYPFPENAELIAETSIGEGNIDKFLRD